MKPGWVTVTLAYPILVVGPCGRSKCTREQDHDDSEEIQIQEGDDKPSARGCRMRQATVCWQTLIAKNGKGPASQQDCLHLISYPFQVTRQEVPGALSQG